MATEGEEREFLRQLDENLISVTEAASMSHLTPSYIRRLLRDGIISGKKLGRDWFTTEKAVRGYLDTERRPGPKTK